MLPGRLLGDVMYKLYVIIRVGGWRVGAWDAQSTAAAAVRVVAKKLRVAHETGAAAG